MSIHRSHSPLFIDPDEFASTSTEVPRSYWVTVSSCPTDDHRSPTSLAPLPLAFSAAALLAGLRVGDVLEVPGLATGRVAEIFAVSSTTTNIEIHEGAPCRCAGDLRRFQAHLRPGALGESASPDGTPPAVE